MTNRMLVLALVACAQAALGADPSEDAATQAASAEPRRGTLAVEVLGIESNRGTVRFLLFDSRKAYLKRAAETALRPVRQGRCTLLLEDLPYGEYALAVYHDEIGDGKPYDFHAVQALRPVGFSNDPKRERGPPSYEDARFVLDRPQLEMSITLSR